MDGVSKLIAIITLSAVVAASGGRIPTARADEAGSVAPTVEPHEAGTDEATDEPRAVIPQGQDELLAKILGKGAPFPHDCAFTNGDARGAALRATYTCSSATVVLTFVHPSKAPRGATETEQFAIAVESGSPPDDFLTALATHVRSHEREFEWKWLGSPNRRFSAWMIVLAIALLGIAVVAWRARRRVRGAPAS